MICDQIPYPVIPGVSFQDIPKYPYYCFGSNGTVWSCRTSSMHGTLSNTWKLLKTKRKPKGYMNLRLVVEGQSYYRYVHRLILEAFIGPCPKGMECRHLDGDPSNNNLSNIQWDSPANNAADKILHGTKIEGSSIRNAITNEKEVQSIKRLLRFGIQHRIIAYTFGITIGVVDGINSERSWKHVKIEDYND